MEKAILGFHITYKKKFEMFPRNFSSNYKPYIEEQRMIDIG